MPTLAEKTKRGLDWLQHGYLLIQIAGSGAVGKAVKAVLVTYTHISSVWVAPIWLGASTATLALLVYIGNRVRRTPVQEHGTQLLAPAPIAQPVAVIDEHYHRINPLFAGEVETSIRQTATQVPPAERETYFCRALTVTFIYAQFELVWYNIFGSQIKALQRLNLGQLRREDIFPYYAEVATANAKTYADYSFDKWLGFMRTQTLIRQDDDLIGITIKGKDFLKFLIDDSKPVGAKTL